MVSAVENAKRRENVDKIRIEKKIDDNDDYLRTSRNLKISTFSINDSYSLRFMKARFNTILLNVCRL